MHYDDGDQKYDEAKDELILCETEKEALQMSKEYPKSMMRFLPKRLRYYLYTVNCREDNKFPVSYSSTGWDRR
jgi:hypothetical protein